MTLAIFDAIGTLIKCAIAAVVILWMVFIVYMACMIWHSRQKNSDPAISCPPDQRFRDHSDQHNDGHYP